MDILNGSEKYEDSCEYLQTAGRRSVVDVQGEDIAFTDLLRIVRKIYGYIMLFFLLFGVLVSYSSR
jgi:hypothetical protein